MTVEHRIARSADPGQQNRYENCMLACRLCNRARGATPHEGTSYRLLDPTQDSWGDHFELAEDCLRPLFAEGDAAFTHRTYDFDDERKVVRRRLRRLLVTDRLMLLQRIGSELEDLLQLAEVIRSRNLDAFFAAIRDIQLLRADALRALEDLRLFAAIPSDKPDECRCNSTEHFQLPTEYEAQTIDFRFPGE